MKKLLTLVFAFVACMAVTNAQFGLRAGLNIANNSYDLDGFSIEPSSVIGFQFGVTYEKMINDNISFRPGLLFSTKGSKVEFGGEEATTSLSYVEIPLDFVYNTGSLGIHAGPYVGILMSAKSEDVDIKDESESLDFGLNVGLSYNINEQISVGLNYGLGLANIAKTEGDDEGTVSNKVIGIFVGYKL